MSQFNDVRWIEHVKVITIFFSIYHVVETFHGKQIVLYRCVVLLGIQVTCSFNKLVHKAKNLSRSELFFVNKSTIHLVLGKFVYLVNTMFKNQVRWLKVEKLAKVVANFKGFYGFHVSMPI
jgi:hypothetical protein